MADVTFEEVAKLAEQLKPSEQAALIQRLETKLHQRRYGLTREQILTEWERRKSADAFNQIESLEGQFAHPSLDPDDDSLLKTLHDIATEWEDELDEFSGTQQA
jgi:hypothetical protein